MLILYCQKRADSTFVPINSALDLALHQMVFALLTAIAIEPVIPEPISCYIEPSWLGQTSGRRRNTTEDEQYSIYQV